MSDFLTNLVSRSFGSAAAVRPRLTSLFEPVREDSAKFRNTPEINHGGTLEAVEDEVLAENMNASISDRKPVSRVARTAAIEDHQHVAPTQDELPAQPVVVRSPRKDQEPQRAATVEKIKSDEAGALVAPIPRGVPDRVPFTPAITERAQGLGKPASALPAMLTAVREPQSGKKQQSLLIPPKATPEMRIPDLALSVRSDRKSHDKERSSSFDPLQPSEPTVNVTIGRIEVRATKESARSTRPASPSPVMSLDEYLRNRARQAGS
jgi:hypothetical protein